MLKDKALTSLSVGDVLLERGFPDDAASRCYYAMYRAAVHALTELGFRPGSVRSGAVEWDHSMVENNVSACRRNPKHRLLYMQMRRLRVLADYGRDSVPRIDIASHRESIHQFVRELAT
jgi:hypothetical protein